MFLTARAGFGRVLFLLSIATMCAAAPATAHSTSGSGGTAYVEPKVSSLVCKDADEAGCPHGGELRIKGDGLAATGSVIFLGKRGSDDDLVASPLATLDHKVVVKVPAKAHTGRVRAVVADEVANGPRLRVSRESVDPLATGVFPIRAKHTYGDGLGAGRGHEGQDIFARCGRKLVAAVDGTVTIAKWQDRAGNYVVVKADDGSSQVYMHMAERAVVEKGDHVTAGQKLGVVGDTGRATGCHLHFELWSAPGWYEGGEPLDPFPALKAWDRKS